MKSIGVSAYVMFLCLMPVLLLSQSRESYEIEEVLSDSLMAMTDTIAADSLIPYCLEFGHNLVRSFPDSALAIYEFATEQAVSQDDQQNEVYGLISQGYALGKLDQTDRSRVKYLASIEIARQIKDSASLFEAHELLAKGYFNNSKFEEAVKHYKTALDFYPTADTAKVIQLHNRIALCQLVNGQMDDAIQFQTKSLVLARSFGKAYVLAEAYWQMGLINKRNNQVQAATRFFLKGLQALNTCGTKDCQNLTTGIQLLLANAYVELTQFDSAAYYFDLLRSNTDYIRAPGAYGFYIHYAKFLEETGQYDKAMAALEQSNDMMAAYMDLEYTIIKNKFRIGIIAAKLGEFNKAQVFLTEAKDWFEQSNNTTELPEAYAQLAAVNYQLGDYQAAYGFQELQITLRDSLNRIETEKNLQELNTKYEVAEQQNKLLIQELELEDQAARNRLLVGGLLLLLGVIGLVLRGQHLKNRTNKMLEEKNHQIQELERLKTRWFTNIAHELRTPLTLVSGPIEKVLDEENVNAPGKEDLLLARRNVKQLQLTIAEILDVSKLEEGQLVINPEPTNLSRMARSAVAAFDSLAKQRKITLLHKVEEGVFATIDESKLNKALLNLLMNAFKFTPQEGAIQLRLWVANVIHIEVTDSGSGISQADLPHVFDRFFQTKSEERSLQGGTGVGLSLTREIIHLHDGEIQVSSVPNEQTTFTIHLPKTRIATPFEEEMVDEQPAPESLRRPETTLPAVKPVILLAEDNADMRQYIRDLLRHDYEMIEAENGKDAIIVLERTSVDLIISDVMMPEMDGISLAKSVKAHETWSDIPFITVTALANEEDKLYTLQIGVDDYLYKPFNPAELKVRVSNLLQNHRERKEATPEPGYDDAVVQQLQELVNSRISDRSLNASALASAANMSDRNLRRYLKKLTGLTPIQFIQELRLVHGLNLLERKKHKTLKEVTHAVGMTRTSHFSDLFERRFGKRPQAYLL